MAIPENSAKKQTSVGNYYLKKFGTESVFSIVPYLTATGAVTFFENQLKTDFGFNQNFNPDPPERYEGDIKSFSVKSRRRLFDLFTQLRYSEYGKPIFVSATYHYDAPDDRATIKNFLAKYIKRIKRELPPFHAIWKFEYQKRGEPHFHFMILPLNKEEDFFTDYIDQIISKHWLALKPCKCNDCQIYAIKTVKINEFSHAMIYISKEIGKVLEHYETHDLGRIWGKSEDIKLASLKEVKCNYEQFRQLLHTIRTNLTLNNCTELYLEAMQNYAVDSSLWLSHEEIKFFVSEWQRNLKPPDKIKAGKLTLKRFNAGGS